MHSTPAKCMSHCTFRRKKKKKAICNLLKYKRHWKKEEPHIYRCVLWPSLYLLMQDMDLNQPEIILRKGWTQPSFLQRVFKYTRGRQLNFTVIPGAWAIFRIIGLCYYNSSCDRAEEGYLDPVATLLNRREPGVNPWCWGWVVSTDWSMLHSSCPCDSPHPMWCLCGPMENASFYMFLTSSRCLK